MKKKIINITVTPFRDFFKKTIWENKEFEKRYNRFVKGILIFGIPSMILLIIDLFTKSEESMGIFGMLGFFLMAWAFMCWGATQAFELAEKITRKKQ